MTRRSVLNWAAGGILVRTLLGCGQQSTAQASPRVDALPGTDKNRKLKVVYVGAHVDDWTVCAGTLARYTREGHEALCFSFTPGDSLSMANAHHIPVEKLAGLRREDAMRGIKIIGAQFKILDQHNQEMRVDPQTYLKFNKTFAAEKPDVVFGMWPLEFHPDHRAAGNLAFNAWLQSGMQFSFYFCETPEAGEMTPQQFAPNRWVNIDSVIDLKHESVVANTFIKDWWPECEMCAKFRGAEYGCRYAEAFVQIATLGSMKTPENPVPGLWYSGLQTEPE
jgi:LmbE family N-acetylglucosaminyl deacetylase